MGDKDTKGQKDSVEAVRVDEVVSHLRWFMAAIQAVALDGSIQLGNCVFQAKKLDEQALLMAKSIHCERIARQNNIGIRPENALILSVFELEQ